MAPVCAGSFDGPCPEGGAGDPIRSKKKTWTRKVARVFPGNKFHPSDDLQVGCRWTGTLQPVSPLGA